MLNPLLKSTFHDSECLGKRIKDRKILALSLVPVVGKTVASHPLSVYCSLELGGMLAERRSKSTEGVNFLGRL